MVVQFVPKATANFHINSESVMPLQLDKISGVKTKDKGKLAELGINETAQQLPIEQIPESKEEIEVNPSNTCSRPPQDTPAALPEYVMPFSVQVSGSTIGLKITGVTAFSQAKIEAQISSIGQRFAGREITNDEFIQVLQEQLTKLRNSTEIMAIFMQKLGQ
ncbi:MAG: hypothetical protein HC894_15760 [Microcoleus sp. SM1_3_4]|nr:hypothetical protein [Microcoleus sp. SM1_3_4]